MTGTANKCKFGNNLKNNKFLESPPDIGNEWETVNLNGTDKIFSYNTVKNNINE